MFAPPLTPTLKDRFTLETQGTMVYWRKRPKIRLEFGKKSIHYQGAKIFNNYQSNLDP